MNPKMRVVILPNPPGPGSLPPPRASGARSSCECDTGRISCCWRPQRWWGGGTGTGGAVGPPLAKTRRLGFGFLGFFLLFVGFFCFFFPLNSGTAAPKKVGHGAGIAHACAYAHVCRRAFAGLLAFAHDWACAHVCAFARVLAFARAPRTSVRRTRICIHVRVAHACARAHVCALANGLAFAHAWARAHAFARARTRARPSAHVCMFACAHVCARTRMCACICTDLRPGQRHPWEEGGSGAGGGVSHFWGGN